MRTWRLWSSAYTDHRQPIIAADLPIVVMNRMTVIHQQMGCSLLSPIATIKFLSTTVLLYFGDPWKIHVGLIFQSFNLWRDGPLVLNKLKFWGAQSDPIKASLTDYWKLSQYAAVTRNCDLWFKDTCLWPCVGMLLCSLCHAISAYLSCKWNSMLKGIFIVKRYPWIISIIGN